MSTTLRDNARRYELHNCELWPDGQVPTSRASDPVDDAYARIRSRLRTIREAAGLSQEEMGFRLGLTQSGYGSWETGRVRPTLYDLVRAAAVLGIDVVELLAEERRHGMAAEVRPAYVAKIDPELAQLVAEIAHLEDDELELAKKQLRLLLEGARLHRTQRAIARATFNPDR